MHFSNYYYYYVISVFVYKKSNLGKSWGTLRPVSNPIELERTIISFPHQKKKQFKCLFSAFENVKDFISRIISTELLNIPFPLFVRLLFFPPTLCTQPTRLYSESLECFPKPQAAQLCFPGSCSSLSHLLPSSILCPVSPGLCLSPPSSCYSDPQDKARLKIPELQSFLPER